MPSDLVVDDIILPPTVTAPCPTSVVVVVRNQGTDPAPYPFAVCLQIAKGGEERFRPEFVQQLERTERSPALFPGQTVSVPFEISFPCLSPVWVMAEADCTRMVHGNLRTNPGMTVYVPSVVPVPWLFTELRVGLQEASGAITWDPPVL